jgi:muconolactone D-isomerase
MARYLVRIAVHLPPEMSHEERQALLEREQARGRELKRTGTIVDMWRVPGRQANIGIWSAPNATTLHEALTSLPVWRFTEIEVTPLADHYLTSDPEGGS